jgi:peptide deformylase
MGDFRLRLDPDPLLYQKLEDLDLTKDYDLVQIEQAMIDIMQTNKGIGISANQVGFDRRVIVVQPKGQEPFALFNPKIINTSTDELADQEGCLSFPNLFLSVNRHSEITVEYVDKHKKSCIIKFTGYDAKCVQHELDHLDGITFTKKVSKLKLDFAIKKQRKLNGRTK